MSIRAVTRRLQIGGAVFDGPNEYSAAIRQSGQPEGSQYGLLNNKIVSYAARHFARVNMHFFINWAARPELRISSYDVSFSWCDYDTVDTYGMSEEYLVTFTEYGLRAGRLMPEHTDLSNYDPRNTYQMARPGMSETRRNDVYLGYQSIRDDFEDWFLISQELLRDANRPRAFTFGGNYDEGR